MEKWERQAGESYSAYEAFQKYLEKRNLREVAAALGVRSLEKLSLL